MEEMTQYLIALIPTITAVISVIAAVVSVFGKIKELFKTTNVEVDELKKLSQEVMKENAELKKAIRLKIDKIADVEDIIDKGA